MAPQTTEVVNRPISSQPKAGTAVSPIAIEIAQPIARTMKIRKVNIAMYSKVSSIVPFV